MGETVTAGARRARLRPAGFDDLGVRRALSDRLLPALVAAMTFLAALTLAGAVATSSLAHHWQHGAAAALTVQVPDPGASPASGEGTRLSRVVAILTDAPGIAEARALDRAELTDLLRPWLGRDLAAAAIGPATAGGDKGGAAADPAQAPLALPLPGVVQVRLDRPGVDLTGLARRLDQAAPGTLVESHGLWVQRLSALARSLQACAAVVLVVVVLVAAAVVAVATRAGLAARRDAIEIVHGLGATDRYIAGRFARRTTMLAAVGAAVGAAAALPVLIGLAGLAAPFASFGPEAEGGAGLLAAVPGSLWLALPCLPLVAAAIGWMTAQGTVRRWLRRLP